MADFRLELNSPEIEKLLRSPEVAREIKRRTENIAQAAGGSSGGMRSRTYQGTDRVRGQVWTGTAQAQRAEAENRALTRAIDAGRS